MVSVHLNPPSGQGFPHLYGYNFGGPIGNPVMKMTEESSDVIVEDPSKKIRNITALIELIGNGFGASESPIVLRKCGGETLSERGGRFGKRLERKYNFPRRSGRCGSVRQSASEKVAVQLAPCAAAARDARAAVSRNYCLKVKSVGWNPKCLCGILLSGTAKAIGVKPGVAITIPKRCGIANRPVGYKCGRDDCISIVNGTQKVQATDITCGPGHGISIGSLGSGNSEAYVSDVVVNGAKLSGTTNGVRIKTWQGGSGSASNIKFQNVEMQNVRNPIIIDQNYCDQDELCNQQAQNDDFAAIFDLEEYKGLVHEDCVTKTRLISLVDLGSNESGQIPYYLIKDTLQIEDSEVEPWVVKAITAKLIDCRIDQINQVVIVRGNIANIISTIQANNLLRNFYQQNPLKQNQFLMIVRQTSLVKSS